MRIVFGVLLIIGGLILGLRFLAGIPEGASLAFVIGYLVIPALLAFAGVRMILKKK